MQCMTVWGGNFSTSQVFDVPGLRIWIHSKAHGGAPSGGDVYYVSSCASGRVTRLLVADVSGHGTAVAATADSLRESMRANVNYIAQDRVVQSVNQEFADRENAEGFATAVVSTFFAPTSKLTLSNAGHPPPLLYSQASGDWSVHETSNSGDGHAHNVPLGIIPETRFDQSQVRLGSGDMVLLYTDAFFESRNARDEMLGSDGLKDILNGCDSQEPDNLVAELLNAIAQMQAGNLESDDATLVLVHATGSKTPIWNSVLAPLRFLGSLIGIRGVNTLRPETTVSGA